MTRETLLAYRERFGDRAPAAMRDMLHVMLDGHAPARLRLTQTAYTGETRMKAALVAAFV